MNPTINPQDMKTYYPIDRRVSVWVGNFPTEDDFDAALHTEVSERLALPTHIESICEASFEQSPVPIRQLVEGFSGWETFIKQVEAKAATQGVSSANAALVCYYLACENAPEQWGPFHFLGTFVGQDVT